MLSWLELQAFAILLSLRATASMPVPQLSEEQEAAAIAKLDSTLSAIFEERKVRRDVQATLANLDITDCETFSLMEENSTALRAWLHSDDVGLAAHGPDKVAVSKVLAAWEAAQERTKTQRTKHAEERSARLPATIPGGAFIAMRRAWEESCAANLTPGQTLKPSELPAKSYLEWRYSQVEDGEFLTESLAEVTSQAEEAQQTDDVTQADVVQQGSKAVIQMRRTRVRSQMPATSEQLRHKYRLLAVHWGMICARYPNKGWAARYHPSVFRDHVDWLLGDDAADMRAAAPEGKDSIKPTWQIILRYELEIRKEATRRINMCGNTLSDALGLARHSDELRTRYLVTPLALSGRRPQQEEDRPAVYGNPQPKRQAQPAPALHQKKGKGQGKGQGKKRKGQQLPERQRTKAARGQTRYAATLQADKDSLHSKHNGKTICFGFQTPQGCSRGQECHHQHICAHCFGSHSFDVCTKYTR